MKILLFTFLISFSAHAEKDDESGFFNDASGDAVVCFKDRAYKENVEAVIRENKRTGELRTPFEDLEELKNQIISAELLDLYFAKNSVSRSGPPFKLANFSGMSKEEILENRLSLLRERTYLYDVLKYASDKMGDWFANEYGVGEIDDAEIGDILPFGPNCMLLQVAYQRKRQGYSPRVYFNPIIEAKLDDINKAALDIHETLQFYRTSSHTHQVSNTTVFNTVKYIFSEEFEKDSPAVTHEKLLKLMDARFLHPTNGQVWNPLIDHKFPLAPGNHSKIRFLHNIEFEKKKKYQLLVPENVVKTKLIFQSMEGADLPREGSVFVNGKKAANLFGDQVSPTGIQIIGIDVAASLFRKGSNTVEIKKQDENSFKFHSLRLRFECNGPCKLKPTLRQRVGERIRRWRKN